VRELYLKKERSLFDEHNKKAWSKGKFSNPMACFFSLK
jgi:hypothetical protein